MTGSQIGEIQPGRRLGRIDVRDDDDEVVRTVAVIDEGLLPKDASLDPEHTKAFIGSHILNNTLKERVVVVVEETEGIVDLQANEAALHDPDFLKGVLKISLDASRVPAARLNAALSNVPPEVAQQVGFQEVSPGVFSLARQAIRADLPTAA